jgi:PAS domain S-box-containing protein
MNDESKTKAQLVAELREIRMQYDRLMRFEQALVESESRYKALYTFLRLLSDNISDMLWAKDLDNRYLFANKALCEKLLMASDVEEPIGKTDIFFAEREREKHPERDDWHTFGEICADSDVEVRKTMQPGRFEEYGNVQGEYLFLDVHKAPLIDWDGKMIGVVGSGRDLTKEKLIEQELAKSEESYKTLISNLPNYVFVHNKGKIVYVNELSVKALGSSAEEIMQSSILDFVDEPYKHLALENMKKRAAGEDVPDYELRIVTPSGTIKDVIVRSAPILFQHEPAYLVVLTDITDRKRIEEQLKEYAEELKELNATKDIFFSIIAHDLKGPFNAILGFSELLSESYDDFDEEEKKKFIHNIKTASDSTFKLLENLLDWSRLQTGKINPVPEMIDLSLLTMENISVLKSMADNKNIKLFSSIQYNTRAYADSNMVRTVLRNLISNAIKFTPRGGEVRIIAGENNKMIELCISDNGVGISEERKGLLFHIDEKLSTPGTANETGTGLGLLLCKEMIERQGGHIRVESEEGKGSRFYFTLPLRPGLKN